VTSKPRINVTLEQAEYDLVKRVAGATGMSMSAFLRDYVEMSRPMLEHMADLADAFEAAERDRRDVHLQAVEGAMEKGQRWADFASGQMALGFDWMQSLTEALEGQSETVAEHLGEGAAVDMTPDSSNTGVRSGKTPLKQEKEEKQENKNKALK
jgi:hypothetical protein